MNQCGPLNDRNVAFRDQIGAVHIAMVKTFGVSQRMVKIGSLVEQLVFNDVTNMLCGISEGKIGKFQHFILNFNTCLSCLASSKRCLPRQKSSTEIINTEEHRQRRKISTVG